MEKKSIVKKHRCRRCGKNKPIYDFDFSYGKFCKECINLYNGNLYKFVFKYCDKSNSVCIPCSEFYKEYSIFCKYKLKQEKETKHAVGRKMTLLGYQSKSKRIDGFNRKVYTNIKWNEEKENKIKKREYDKEWRKNNPDKLKEKNSKYYKNNKEKIRKKQCAYNKKYYKNNKEKIKEKIRKYRKENKKLQKNYSNKALYDLWKQYGDSICYVCEKKLGDDFETFEKSKGNFVFVNTEIGWMPVCKRHKKSI